MYGRWTNPIDSDDGWRSFERLATEWAWRVHIHVVCVIKGEVKGGFKFECDVSVSVGTMVSLRLRLSECNFEYVGEAGGVDYEFWCDTAD